jgi:hypothetical protein
MKSVKTRDTLADLGFKALLIQSEVRASYRPTSIFWGYENCIEKTTIFKR